MSLSYVNLYEISSTVKNNKTYEVSELLDVFKDTDELELEIKNCNHLEKYCNSIINNFNICEFNVLLDNFFQLSERTDKLNNYIYIVSILEKSLDAQITEKISSINTQKNEVLKNITRIINELDKTDYIFLSSNNSKYKKYIDYIKKEQLLALNQNDSAKLSSIVNNYYYLIGNTKKPYIYSNFNFEELNYEKYIQCLNNKSRTYRKKAFDRYFSSLKKNEKDFANNLNSFVKESNKITYRCGYESTRDYCLEKTGVNEKVYTTALGAVNDNINELYSFYGLKKDLLGISSLETYDMIYSPYNERTNITFEEAKEIIINSLYPLGEEYMSLVNKMFKNGWIIMSSSGNFNNSEQIDFYSSHPYIITNYSGKIEDVYSLTHEIGHAIHSYINSNKYEYWEYSIPEFLSEVFSSLCEILLANYLIDNSKNINERNANILCYLDIIVGSVYKQAQITEFEELLYQSEFETNKFSEHYFLLCKKYNPYQTELSNLESVNWCRLSSLYMSYYSYQYITSFCAAAWIIKTDINLCFQLTDINQFCDLIYETKKIGVDFEDESMYDSLFETFSDYVFILKKDI